MMSATTRLGPTRRLTCRFQGDETASVVMSFLSQLARGPILVTLDGAKVQARWVPALQHLPVCLVCLNHRSPKPVAECREALCEEGPRVEVCCPPTVAFLLCLPLQVGLPVAGEPLLP